VLFGYLKDRLEMRQGARIILKSKEPHPNLRQSAITPNRSL